MQCRAAEPAAPKVSAPERSAEEHAGFEAELQSHLAMALLGAPARTSGAAVQRHADASTGEDPAAVQQAAEAGLSGGATPLPHAGRIQAAFGQHDVSSIRAHVGGPAVDAADAMGADAYATGNHVAFREQPDLHTAAHEAAHVVQQRAGVQLKGGVGQAGDAYEQHADRVADAVVRGASAAPILGELAGESKAERGAGAPSVQRKGKAGKQRALRDYEASWDDVATAAKGNRASIDKLDVAWIDGLDPYVVQEIDREFHEPKVKQEFAKKHAGSKDIKAIKASYENDKKRIRLEAMARLKAAGVRKGIDEAISKDPEYITDLEEFTNKRDLDLETAKTEQQAAFDAQQVKPKAPMMVMTPPEEGVTRAQGRMLARADFMSWGILVLGSADRVKEHFRAIRPVPGTRGMYLHKAAADRYVAAREWFENTYRGYTFLNTTVAMQLRNRHQEGHTMGKLGHPLGLSADFAAYDNPNQLGDGVSQYMLRRFGGANEETPGANQIKTRGNPAEMTREIGRATVQGHELTAQQLAYLDSVEQGYNEMIATSRRFQASRAEQMPELRQAENLWFKAGIPALARVRAAEKMVKTATKAVQGRLGKQLRGLDDKARQAMIESDPRVQAAIEARDAAQQSFDTIKDEVTAVMQDVFEPWTRALQGDVDASLATHQPAHVNLDVTVAQVDSLLGRVKTLRTRKHIDNFVATNRKIFAALDTSALPEHVADARDSIEDYLTAVRDAKWSSGEIRVQLELIRRLTESPAAVFGTQSVRDKETDRLKHKTTVSAPPVMQYLECGFARGDDMPEKPDARAGGKDAKGVFNAEFIRCMTMFGFNTLATWRGVDTMHFDFREGFDGIQQHDLYSP